MSGSKDKKHLVWRGEIGPLLEEARERRGISLKEAEQSTSIRWRYLEGLEREEPSELPGKGYVQSFLQSYAEFLGLDAEELNDRFKKYDVGSKRRRQRRNHPLAGNPADESSQGATNQDRPSRGGPGRRPNWKSSTLVAISVAGLVLVLAAAAFYVPWDGPLLSGSPSGGQQEQAPSDDDPAAGEPNGPPQDSPREGAAPTLENGAGEGGPEGEESLRAEVRVRDAESWISVETDSGVEYMDIAQPGFSRSFESGESLRITTGNVGAVELRINGIDYGNLGASGEVTSKSFTLKKAR